MASTRYRCTGCGNLTRFDVVTDRRTRAFHHYTVGGELSVEDEQVLEETMVEISCRWCGHGRGVEVLTDSVSHLSATLSATTSDREPGSG